MTILVTGATGFVGAAVARALIADGNDLRLIARIGSDRRNLDGLQAEIVEADLTDSRSLRAAVKGCQAVFHVAADYRLWAPDPRPMFTANVDGTVNLFRAPKQVSTAWSIPPVSLFWACTNQQSHLTKIRHQPAPT